MFPMLVPAERNFPIFPDLFWEKVRRVEMKRRRWSEDDIARLRGMAQKMLAPQIAVELGRGVAAVAMKAHKLKLSLRISGRKEATHLGLRRCMRLR